MLLAGSHAAIAAVLPPFSLSSTTSVADHALSIPAILRNVLLHLETLCIPLDAHIPTSQTHVYPELCRAALVARSWTPVTRSLLERILVFDRGTKQLLKWLKARNQNEEAKYDNREVVLFDELPFIPGKSEEDGAKWHYEVIKKMLSKVNGLKALVVLFMGQKELPGDWLVGENIKEVEILITGSPFSATAAKLSFSLVDFKPFDAYPETRLPRSWTSTFQLLESYPTSKSLLSLHLTELRSFERYLTDLAPLASALRIVHLPTIRNTLDAWRILPFATACTALENLHIRQFEQPQLIEVLLSFPPILKTVWIDLVEGSLIPYASDKRTEEVDAWSVLAQTVEKMQGLQQVIIGCARKLSLRQYQALLAVTKVKSVVVEINFWDHELTEEEMKLLDIQKSPEHTVEMEKTASTNGESKEHEAVKLEAKADEEQVEQENVEQQ
ncbi:hypothetical protein JCM8547_006262 [Rhodosporidiobolus lusitaniae]